MYKYFYMVKNHKKNRKSKLPFVSVCTPTFNRRPFIPGLIQCFQSQDYPKDKIEWIIIDDGTDKIEDLVSHIPQVKYFTYDEQMALGKKRNLLNEKASGDIIIYMDDDDYHFPTRISHSVQMLKLHPKCLCAGSSALLIYFKTINKLYLNGPFSNNHATAGTFAFRKSLLEKTSFEETAAISEEKYFLKDFSIPVLQLDYKQTIITFSHSQNTFNKEKMLENGDTKYLRPADINVDFVKDKELLKFYKDDVHNDLDNYNLGDISLKPLVMEQLEKKKKGEQMLKDMFQEQKNKMVPTFTITNPDGSVNNYSVEQILDILNKKEQYIIDLIKELREKDSELRKVKEKLRENSKDNSKQKRKNT